MELGLIAAMCNLKEQEVVKCNFQQIFHVYSDFISKNSTRYHSPKDECLKGFEHLVSLGFVVAVQGQVDDGHGKQDFQLFKLMFQQDEINLLFQHAPDVYTALQKWATSWLE
jgi:hypothetical protein